MIKYMTRIRARSFDGIRRRRGWLVLGLLCWVFVERVGHVSGGCDLRLLDVVDDGGTDRLALLLCL